jgi:predicted CopG family antitoxin
MGDSTTIAITKEVYKELLKFVHSLETDEQNKISFSYAINYLLKKVKEI